MKISKVYIIGDKKNQEKKILFWKNFGLKLN